MLSFCKIVILALPLTLSLMACGGGDAKSPESSANANSISTDNSRQTIQAVGNPTSLLNPGANCHGRSLVTVVAHMDDDLFFVDPAISTAARAGACVTTVFVIGGSSGAGFDHVPTRELASMTAYARMFGVASTWTSDLISVGDVRLKRASLATQPNLSLVFMRLPGGNVRGGEAPLSRLFDDASAVQASWSYTDSESGGTNEFTRSTLISTVTSLIDGFGATEVAALNPDTIPYVEHPDHIYSARLTREALRLISTNIPVKYHETYPTSIRPANVKPTDVQLKRDLLGAYMGVESNFITDGIFGEHMYNGNWIARNYSRSANAWDNTATVDTPLAPIVNLHTQHCLTSSGVNQPVFLSGCVKGSSNQQWRFTPSNVGTGDMGTALIRANNGNCLELRSASVIEVSCDAADASQQWQPWDFGKIFSKAGHCMIQSGNQFNVGDCTQDFPERTLWSRQLTTVDNDKNLEVALVGNVSGSGVDQLVLVHRRSDGPGVNVWVSNLQDGQTTLSSNKWFDGAVSFNPSGTAPTCGDASICYDQSRYLLADFNGDGKSDLMVITPSSGGTSFSLLTSTGKGFSQPVLWAQTSEIYSYDLAHQYLVGEFTGDGRPDVMIAHTRGDSGLNFWVLANSGQAKLSSPSRWASAPDLSNNARLYSAKLDNSGRSGLVAIDEANGLRVSSFLSTGQSFTQQNVSVFNLFDFSRSKVTVTQSSASALSDIWVLHARADSTDINAWQLTNGTGGRFNSPVLRKTISEAAWNNVRPYFAHGTTRNKLLLVRRVDTNVSEYAWRTGAVAASGYGLNSTGLDGTSSNYGETAQFEWTNVAWRAALNH